MISALTLLIGVSGLQDSVEVCIDNRLQFTFVTIFHSRVRLPNVPAMPSLPGRRCGEDCNLQQGRMAMCSCLVYGCCQPQAGHNGHVRNCLMPGLWWIQTVPSGCSTFAHWHLIDEICCLEHHFHCAACLRRTGVPHDSPLEGQSTWDFALITPGSACFI